MIVRRASQAAFPLWARMLAKLHRGESAADFENELQALTVLPEPYVGFLAFDGDTPAGMIDARVRNYAEGAPDLRAAYVEDLWVEPEYRRLSVGRQLLAAVEAWSRDQGLSWLGSDTELANRDSQNWHERVGFAEIERIVVFGKPLR